MDTKSWSLQHGHALKGYPILGSQPRWQWIGGEGLPEPEDPGGRWPGVFVLIQWKIRSNKLDVTKVEDLNLSLLHLVTLRWEAVFGVGVTILLVVDLI